MDTPNAVPEILMGNSVFMKVRGSNLETGQQILLNNEVCKLGNFKESEYKDFHIRSWAVENSAGKFYALAEFIGLDPKIASEFEAKYMKEARENGPDNQRD